MNTHADKTQENKSQSVTTAFAQKQKGGASFQFVDNRPEAIAQRKLQEVANNRPKKIIQTEYGQKSEQDGESIQLKQDVAQLGRTKGNNNGKQPRGGPRKLSDIHGRRKPKAEQVRRKAIDKNKEVKQRRPPPRGRRRGVPPQMPGRRAAAPVPVDDNVLDPVVLSDSDTDVSSYDEQDADPLFFIPHSDDSSSDSQSEISSDDGLAIPIPADDGHHVINILGASSSDENSSDGYESDDEEEYRERVYVGRTVGDASNLVGALGSELENSILVIVGGAGVTASGIQLLITARNKITHNGRLEREALGTIAMGLVNLASGLSGVCSGFIRDENDSETAGVVSSATWAGVEFLSILTQIDLLITDPEANRPKAIASIVASLLKCIGATLSAFEHSGGNWVALLGAVIGALHGILKLGYKARQYFGDDDGGDSSDDSGDDENHGLRGELLV